MPGIDEALLAHLSLDVTSICYCWRVARNDGAIMGFTDHDRPVHCDATDFLPQTGLTASEARSTLGLAPGSTDVEGALSAAVLREEDIEAGLYDGAKIETLLVNWQVPVEFTILRTAFIGKLERRDGRFVAELESFARQLDQPNGKTVRRHCDAALGDARCAFDLQTDGFNASGVVIAIDQGDIVRVSGLTAFDAGWFSEGLLTWTSGANTGRSERISAHCPADGHTVLGLWREGTVETGIGDAFDIVAGCDKRFSTCKSKFSNSLNFRGFPHLPGDDSTYGYVSKNGRFDGGALVP